MMRGYSPVAELSHPIVQVAAVIGDPDATRLHVTQTASTPKQQLVRVITLTIDQAQELTTQLQQALEEHAKANRSRTR